MRTLYIVTLCMSSGKSFRMLAARRRAAGAPGRQRWDWRGAWVLGTTGETEQRGAQEVSVTCLRGLAHRVGGLSPLANRKNAWLPSGGEMIQVALADQTLLVGSGATTVLVSGVQPGVSRLAFHSNQA
jgi:hypothetical protein